MSRQEIAHGQFTIERIYDASPARVFSAWADPAVKARWFVGPQGWTPIERKLDFRVGGQELLHGRFAAKETHFLAQFHDGTDGNEGTVSRQLGTAAHLDRLALQL